MSSASKKLEAEKQWYNSFWFRFLIGGIVVAGTSQLAANVGPKFGAIFWSVPFTLVPTFLYFWSIQLSPKKVRDFAQDTVVSLFNLMAFIFTVAIAMSYPAFHGEDGILWAMAVGFVVWGIGSLLLLYKPWEGM
jgi:hypothetical protein